MIGGIAALLVASAGAAWLLIVLLRLLPQRGYTWRYGLANLRRRPLGSSLQIGALSLGVMALLLLTLVRGDLMRSWRASLPPDAPNAFLINVLPDQVDGVAAMLKRELNVDAALRPMVRGRLVSVNGAPFDTPTTLKPGGSCVTRSPWLIHTVSRSPFFHTPSNRADSPVTSNSARPNSRWWPPSTLPPSWATMVCSP